MGLALDPVAAVLAVEEGVRRERFKEVNAQRDFGAVANGSTDATTALQNFANSLADGRRGVMMPGSGAYVITSTITLPEGCDLYIHPKVSIDATALASGTAAFQVVGSQAVGTDVLTANATLGDTQVQIGVGMEANYAAGDYVKLVANDYFAGSGPASTGGVDAYIGEHLIVKSVASGIVRFDTPIADSYATAKGAYIVKETMLKGPKIHGRGRIFGRGSGYNQRGILLDRVIGGNVDATVDLMENTGIALNDCIGTVITMRGDGGGAHTNSTFYGVSFFSCQDCWWTNCVIRRYKHAVTTTGSTNRGGINRRLHYVNSKVLATTSIGIDCHAMVEDLTIQGCSVWWPGNEADDSGDSGGGISVRSPSATLTGNRVYGGNNYGIWLRNQSTRPTSYKLNGDHVSNVTSYGVRFSLHIPPSSGLTIHTVSMTGVTVTGAGGDGFNILSNNTNGDHLTAISLTGCSTRNCTGFGINASSVDGMSIMGGTHADNTSGAIQLTDCTGTAITGLSGSATGATGAGISLTGTSTGNTITGCSLTGFATGLLLDVSTSGNTAAANTLTSCTTPVSNGGTGNRVRDEQGGLLNLGDTAGIAYPNLLSIVNDLAAQLGDYRAVVATVSSLLSRWKLNEATGVTTYRDDQAGRDLSRTGTGIVNDQTQLLPGATPRAPTFNGVDNLQSTSGDSTFNSPLRTASWSVEALIKPTATPASQATVARFRSSSFSAGGWNMYIDSAGKLVIQVADAGGVSKTVVGTTNNVGSIIHACATYDGTTLRLYRNGTLVGSTVCTYLLPSAGSSTQFKVGQNLTTNAFTGAIGDVAVYSAALDVSDILQHAQLAGLA